MLRMHTTMVHLRHTTHAQTQGYTAAATTNSVQLQPHAAGTAHHATAPSLSSCNARYTLLSLWLSSTCLQVMLQSRCAYSNCAVLIAPALGDTRARHQGPAQSENSAEVGGSDTTD